MPCIIGTYACALADGSMRRNGRAPPRPRWPSAWRALGRWRRDKRAVAALQALDERMLKDIGIDRSEIRVRRPRSGSRCLARGALLSCNRPSLFLATSKGESMP